MRIWKALLCALFVACVTVLCFQNFADAAVHPLPLFYPFDDPNQKACFFKNLDIVNLDGLGNQEEKIKREVKASAAHISSTTNFNIEFVPLQECLTHNLIYGGILKQPYHWAVVEVGDVNGKLFKTMTFSTGIAHQFSVSGTCAPGETTRNIRYIANHEFGHFAGLGHPEEGKTPMAGETMMAPGCSPDYGSAKPGDIAQINSLYPIIPAWIKDNAELWSSGLAEDARFVDGLEYLIDHGVLEVALPETRESKSNAIPSWIKTNARLWHQGLINDDTFTRGMEYLIQIGVIQVGSPGAASVAAVGAGAASAAASASTITPAADSSRKCEPACFVPGVLRVAAGTTVTFSNTDDAGHTFTHGDPFVGKGGAWDSGLVSPGESYSVTLAEGTYTYFSKIDPWMQGSIVVGGSSTNDPPVANAGGNQTVDERSTVILSGSGTDAESPILRYAWTQISGPQVQLSGSNYPGGMSHSRQPYFTAPETTSSATLQFRLTVKDSILQPATDTMTVTVRNIDSAPNRAPTASAGPDQTVNEGTTVTLDGSGSSDPDAGDVLTYKWTQLQGPTVALSSTSAQSPAFQAPDVKAGSVRLQFKLVVRDSSGAPGHPDYAYVTVSDVPAPPTNRAPVARADVAQASGTDPITIDVLFNDSDPEGDALSISSVDAASTSGTVSISSDKSDLSFTASSGFSGTTTFTYVASDARGAASPPARVTVDVLRPPSAAGAAWARAYVPSGGGAAFFGQALDALPNGNVLVGAPLRDLVVLLAADSGSFVYTLDRDTSDRFGASVAALGSGEAVVGAPKYDDVAGGAAKADAGRAYVLDSSGAVRLTLPHPEPAAGDEFGASVAADAANGRIFVGAPERDIVVRSASAPASSPQPLQPADGGGGAGAAEPAEPADLDLVWDDPSGPARVVDRSTGSAVHQIASFVSYDPLEGATAAGATPESGSAAEADGGDDPEYYDGSVPLMDLDPDEGLARLIDADTRAILASARIGPGALSASSSADGAGLEGRQHLIAFHNARSGTSYVYDAATARLSMTEYRGAGAVYAFNSSTGAYVSPPILNPHPGSGDKFGYSIDVMANGNLAVGTPRDEPRSAGSVYVMDGSTKAQVHRLANPSVPHGASDDFGTAVAAAGNYLVIGAPDDDGAGNAGPSNSGAIYVYDGAAGARKAYLPAASHASSSASRSDDFGEVVAGSADGKLAIGASEDGGYALIFSFDGTDASLVKKVEPSGPSYYSFGSAVAVSGAAKNVAISDYAYRPHGTVFLYDSHPPPRPNSPPSAADDAAAVDEDSTGNSVLVLSNDTDSDGDALTISSVNAKGARGAASVSPASSTSAASVLFTPEPDFAGTTSFSYMVSDGNGGTDTASVAVTVAPVNDAPVAEPDSAATSEDVPVTIRVLDNDSDMENDALSVHSVDGAGARGTATANPDGTVTFRPAADAAGDTSFSYRASDGNGGISEPAAVVVVMTPRPDAPSAYPDAARTLEDEPVVVAVLSNDTDADAGDMLRVTAVTAQPARGTASVDVDGAEVTYAPRLNYHGADSFRYAIVDSSGLTSSASVSVAVESVNDAPFVPPIPDSTVRPGDTLSFAAVYVDYDSDTAVFSLSDSAPHGASISASGDFSWTPTRDQAGPHAFEVIATDAGAPPLSGSYGLTVTVLDVVPPAITAPADIVAEASGPLTRVLLGTATATDADPILEVTNDAPAQFPLGATKVTWTAADRSGNSSSAEQTVTVQDTAPPAVIAPQDVGMRWAPQIRVALGSATASDAVDPRVTITNDAPPSFPEGLTTVTWTATDDSGNSSSAEQQVALLRAHHPSIYRVSDVRVEAPVAPAAVEFDLPLSGDATAKGGCHPAPGSSFDAGTTIVACAVATVSGRSHAASFRVVVDEDLGDAAIAIAAPPDIRAESSAEVVLGSATAVSAADPSPTVTNDAPSSFPPGATVVIWTATDSGGNAATDTQTVTVTGPSRQILSDTFDSIGERWDEYGMGHGCIERFSDDPARCRVSGSVVTTDANWRSGAPDNGIHPPGRAAPNRVAETDDCTGFCVMELKSGLDMTGYGAAELSLWRYINDSELRDFGRAVTYLRLDASSNGGADWRPVAIWQDTSEHAGEWRRETFDLSGYLTSLDFKIRFASHTYGPESDAMIDDLVISGTPAARDAPPSVSASDLAAVRGSSSTAAVSASDPDGDSVSLSMSAGAPGFVTLVDHGSGRGTITAAPSASDSGSHPVTVTATAGPLSSSSTLTVAVVDVADTVPPMIDAPPDKTIEATGALTAVNLGTPAASDRGGLAPAVSSDAPERFPLGRTAVTWTATDSAGNSAHATQHVTVRDTTPPRIETGPWGRVPYGTAFAHDVVAIDAVDGDLTGSIARTGAVDSSSEGAYVVSYSVSDSAGNSAQVSGVLRVDDWRAPRVTLSGGTSVAVKTGGSFEDPGAAAADPFTGAAVPVSVGGDAVDTSVNGTYKVVYSAADGRGNTGYATRTVTVTPTPDSPPGIYGAVHNPSMQWYSQFGSSMAVLDDGLVAIGAPYDYAHRLLGGAVHIFDSEDWSLVRTLRHPTGEGMTREFGDRVGNAGDGLVAVGTPYDFTGGRYRGGVVHIFDAETGAHVRDIRGPPEARFFGSDLGFLENGDLAIGSNHEGHPGRTSGAVYVYTSSGTQVHKFVRSDATDRYFGEKLAVLKNDILASYDHRLIGSIYRYSGVTGDLVHAYPAPPSTSGHFGNSVAANESGHFATSASRANPGQPSGAVYLYDAQNRPTTILANGLDNVQGFGNSLGMTDDAIAIGASDARYYGGLNVGNIFLFDKGDLARPFASIPKSATGSYPTYMVPFGDNDMLLRAHAPQPPYPHNALNSLVYLVSMQPPEPPAGGASGAAGAGAEPAAPARAGPARAGPDAIASAPAAGLYMPALLGFDFTGPPHGGAPDPGRAYMALRFTSSLDGLPVGPGDFEVTGKDGAWPFVIDAVADGDAAVLALDRGSLYLQPRQGDPDPGDFEVLVRAPWAAVPTDPAAGSVEILGVEAYSDALALHWNVFGDSAEYKAVLAPSSSPNSKTADIASDSDRYVFVNLEPDTEYEVRVGVRGDDSTQSARTVRTMPEGALPFHADLYPSVAVTGDAASLRWMDVNGVGEGRYRVERSVDGGPFAQIENQPGAGTAVRDALDPEWRGKPVSYRVFEWVGSQKLYSDAVSFVPLPR